MLTEFWPNLIAFIHIAWVLFTVAVFMCTYIAVLVRAKFLDWFWFRTIHLIFVLLITLLPRFGMSCPLSTIEHHLRMQSGSAFIEGFALHYLQKFIYEGIEQAFVDTFTLLMYLGTLAAYLYRPPRRAARLAKA